MLKFDVAGMLAALTAKAVVIFARAVTGVRGDWRGCLPDRSRRVYYANHSSHGDFVLIWTVLPRRQRRATRPVAGLDYWDNGPLRRFVGNEVFRAVLINRQAVTRQHNPITLMSQALDGGDSLIFFPEGTRNATEERLLPFKNGLFHLAKARPEVELVPVWIENLNRALPKGELLPIPLLCSVIFGEPTTLKAGESKAAFLERTRDALLVLAPEENGESA